MSLVLLEHQEQENKLKHKEFKRDLDFNIFQLEI